MRWSATATLIACASLPGNALAQPARIDISARTLAQAIAELSREAGVSIGTEGSLPAIRTPEVHGALSVEQALDRILDGSGFVAVRAGQTAWRIERAPVRLRAATPAPAAVPTERVVPEASPPIIVYASKTGRDLQSLSLDVALVDLSQDSQARTPDAGTRHIASQVEGLSLTGSGPGRNRMFLRGVADSPFNGESQSTVAILVDNARITYSAPDPDIRLVDMESVEVLKGPQGSLYGTGALGGIYQLRTNLPRMGETSLAVTGSGSVVAHGGTGDGATAVANLPVAGDSVALRLVGYTAEEAGWIDSGSRADGNAVTTSGLRAALAAEAGSGWRIDLSGLVQLIDADDTQYVYREGARSRPAQLPEPHDNDIMLAAARLSGPLGAVDFELDSSLVWHEVNSTFDATQGAQSFGLADPHLLHDERSYRIWNVEGRLHGSLGDVDWLLGASRIEASQDMLALLEGESGATLTMDDDRRTSSESAVFGNARLPLSADFSVEAGARLFVGTVKDTRLVSGTPVTRDLHRTGLTPSAALSWTPRDTRLVYLRYGSALRQGGVEIDAGGAVDGFDSDELETIELGWREQMGHGGRFQASVFYTRWKDIQADLLQADGIVETTNAGTGEIAGLEASLDQPLGADWSLELGGSVLSSRLTRDDTGLELRDRRLPVVPEYAGRAALTYEFAAGRADGLVRLRTNYTGPSRLSFDPLLNREMGDVLEAGVEAGLAWHNVTASLAIDNLLGSHADTFAYGNQLRIFRDEQFTPVRPTTATVSLGVGF